MGLGLGFHGRGVLKWQTTTSRSTESEVISLTHSWYNRRHSSLAVVGSTASFWTAGSAGKSVVAFLLRGGWSFHWGTQGWRVRWRRWHPAQRQDTHSHRPGSSGNFRRQQSNLPRSRWMGFANLPHWDQMGEALVASGSPGRVRYLLEVTDPPGGQPQATIKVVKRHIQRTQVKLT